MEKGEVRFNIRQIFSLPQWVEWIAVDDDGEVFGFEDMPNCKIGIWDADGGRCHRIGVLDFALTEDDAAEMVFSRDQILGSEITEDDIFTITQAAAKAGTTRQSLHRWHKAGLVRFIKVTDHRFLMTAEEVDRVKEAIEAAVDRYTIREKLERTL